MDYPEHLVDAGLFDRALARFNEAVASRARAQAAVTDAIGAQRNAEAAHNALVLRSSKEGNVPLAESLGARQAVRDAEQHGAFLREAVAAAETEVNAAQLALNAASSDMTCTAPCSTT